MSRAYEVVYLFDPSLEEAAITEKLDRFHAMIPQPEGASWEVSHWGKRTLAYPINRHESGYYVIAKFSATPEALPEFERALKLDDSVIRHLIVLDEGAQMAPTPSAKDGEDDE